MGSTILERPNNEIIRAVYAVVEDRRDCTDYNQLLKALEPTVAQKAVLPEDLKEMADGCL
jgi:hypothetical protein